MTDAPKTLTLSAREWNALLASNAADLAALFQSQPNPTPELYTQIANHMDRMKGILPGWLSTGATAGAGAGQAETQPAAQANGAEPVAPKKGGWPKGKKRGAPAQVVQ